MTPLKHFKTLLLHAILKFKGALVVKLSYCSKKEIWLKLF
jgi:hypothetical protein